MWHISSYYVNDLMEMTWREYTSTVIRMKTCSGTDFFGWIAVWIAKKHKNNISCLNFHSSYLPIPVLSKCVTLLLEKDRFNFNVYLACLSMIGSKQFVGKNQIHL